MNADTITFVVEKFEMISECGYNKPSSKLSLTDKVDLIHSVALHHVILKTLGEISQFREGLESCGVLKAINKYAPLMCEFYVVKESKLSAGIYIILCV